MHPRGSGAESEVDIDEFNRGERHLRGLDLGV